MLQAQRRPAVHYRTMKESEKKRKQEVYRDSQEHDMVVRVQKKKIQSGRKRNKRFDGEGGVKVLHQQRGTD